MKYLSMSVLIMLLISCSNDPQRKIDSWDSGANKTRSYNDERASEQDESARDQFPKPTPATNQNPF